jgi:hypothetical protein
MKKGPLQKLQNFPRLFAQLGPESKNALYPRNSHCGHNHSPECGRFGRYFRAKNPIKALWAKVESLKPLTRSE